MPAMNQKTVFQICMFLAMFCLVTNAISVDDVYKRLLEREKNVDTTFANSFIRPVGSVGGELIWPRSYSRPSRLFFDENGSAYNVAARRPTLREILRRTSIGRVDKNIDNNFA